MLVYKEEFTLREELKTSGVLRLMQEAAGEHCEQIGLGVAVTGPKNLMWVIIRQYLEMRRWPEPGEKLRLCTWPGPTRHMFFPRFTQLKTAEGELISCGSALWTLVDRSTRKMISPAAYGLAIDGMRTGEECRLPTAPGKLPMDQSGEFIVTADVLDGNNHMNNTRYYDLAEAVFGDLISGKRLVTAMTEHVSEAREGDPIHLSWGRDGDRYYITGTGEENVIFRMSLEYGY